MSLATYQRAICADGSTYLIKRRFKEVVAQIKTPGAKNGWVTAARIEERTFLIDEVPQVIVGSSIIFKVTGGDDIVTAAVLQVQHSE